jgi:hypothetical protein
VALRWWKRLGAALGLSAAVLVPVLFATAAAASRPAAYCSAIPYVNVPKQAWGFSAGKPITGATGSYARGHGTINLTAHTTTGIVCQVDRVSNAPDRQIILSVAHHLVYASHHAVKFGVPGNIMTVDVRVTNTTDPNCPVGTSGQMTLFASFNGVRKDSVQFSFPAACRDHRRTYTGSLVNTNVPPN